MDLWNNILFNHYDTEPMHNIIWLMIILNKNVTNSVSSLFAQDCNVGSCTKLMKKNQLTSSWISSPGGWIKIKVDASKRTHYSVNHDLICYEG